MTMGDLEGPREWVERTCAEQGFDSKVSDIGTVLKIAAMFGATSDPPDGAQALHVDFLPAVPSRTNDNVVEDSRNDGAALVEIHVAPFAPEVTGVVDEPAQ